MELEELFRLIALSPEAVSRLREAGAGIGWEQADVCLEQMLDRDRAGRAYGGLKAALGEDGDGMKMLCCQLECARRAWDRYQSKKIPGSIYRDTMGCFPRFLKETQKRTGRLLFDRGWWTWRQTSMSLFRLGALEYELREQDGVAAVAVHIPSDADFSEEAVDASLAQADAFFRVFFPDWGGKRCICSSWLLSPALRPFLGENSRILSFQRRFDLVSTDSGDREFVEWLFQAPADTAAADLREETSLQRAVKALLLSGGTVGSACGTMRRRVG